MLPTTSYGKKPKSPGFDATVNCKTSVTCSNVPDGLFDPSTAKRHFSKFGRVQRIRLFPKRQSCIVEYDQPLSVERAVLNAGAFDGFMFDVTRNKPRVRKRSKKDDDPDWVPDSDVEEELSAMSGTPLYRTLRQKPMETELEKPKTLTRVVKQSPVRKKIPVRERKPALSQPTSGIESPVPVVISQTMMSTFEAATELHQLRSKTAFTPDEQWRILETRDKILRSWGGAGSRVKAGGATIGTCRDMCPEKELLHRQAEHQVMTLETVPDSDGQLEPWRAVKQYSRSSADQEIPMCYELRPAGILMRTCSYLLREIADTKRQVSLADWFHFMWDRLRSIRKDITQQALCCSDSICLVEMCARFHAHCAARLADLEHTQFDQKLNTDNLTKCLQTLKHMYADVTPAQRPREAEFRGYIALLNLGDANFWWEIKQLPKEIQKSPPIIFAMQVFNALDNNNYVRFFRLIKEKATYLQACILLRYFNDVRARALARIVKAYAPRGGSRFPASDMMNALAFESIENMNSFINHYGLRFAKTDDYEHAIILDRNQFIEDSDPYPTARAINLIESKRQCTVGEVIGGGQIFNADHSNHILHTSFTNDGKLKESALVAEDQGYNTVNDSNKDVGALKAEIHRLAQVVKSNANLQEPKGNIFVKPDFKTLSPKPKTFPVSKDEKNFSFKPAIPVASNEVLKNSPENMVADAKNMFSFSKPQETVPPSNLFSAKAGGSMFGQNAIPVFGNKTESDPRKIFGSASNEKTDLFKIPQNVFKSADSESVFKRSNPATSIFGQSVKDKQTDINKNLFANDPILTANNNIESQGTLKSNNVFSSSKEMSLFSKPDTTAKFDKGVSIFGEPVKSTENKNEKPANIFGAFNKVVDTKTVFGKQTDNQKNPQSIFAPNGDAISPGSLFKSVLNPPNGSDAKSYTIFQSKNKPQTVADNILLSVQASAANNNTIYGYEPKDDAMQRQLELQHQIREEKLKEEEKQHQERLKKEEEMKHQEQLQLEQERRKEDARIKEEQQRLLEEKRKREEEKRQEELKKRLEEERKAELKRKAEEAERKLRETVDKESAYLVEELTTEINNETITNLLQEEKYTFDEIIKCTNETTDEIVNELANEIVWLELKAEYFLTMKIMKKWYNIWRHQFMRNFKRRRLLEDTPVWLPERSPVEEASHLRRLSEKSALKNMNAIHRGYKFVGELKPIPSPEPYNLMELIKSPLLKRMKQISYPYGRCFFWKVTLVAPSKDEWLCRKINIQQWLIDAFGDGRRHEESETLLHVSKETWNHLMDFAISVSLVNISKMSGCAEALEGANAVLFYSTENDKNFIGTIKQTLEHKYPYQTIPVAVILPKKENLETYYAVQKLLDYYVSNGIVSGYKVFLMEPHNIVELMNTSTKSAIRWLAKKFPQTPPLEIDSLKSICQRYLGNEIWCKFRTERDSRMSEVLKDIHKLIKCYNAAVDRLMNVITNEDLFNYIMFPLEFRDYLDHTSPYPKSYEFIPSSVRTSENVSTIKDLLKHLKLPDPKESFNPLSVEDMQECIRTYCNQIGWFDNPEVVVCKVVAVLPNEISDLEMTCDDFTKYFSHYDLIDFLNIIVYEKINRLKAFNNRFAIYKKSVLEEYKNINWLYEVDALNQIKHKAVEYDDELDYFIEAKRRKIANDSMEYLMLEDKDTTLVEENIKKTDRTIAKLSDCSLAVKQLEKDIEDGKRKSVEFENILRAALAEG